MRSLLPGLILLLAGCVSLPIEPGPAARQADAACTQDCQVRLEQCPRIFAGFPEHGAVECPAAHEDCLKTCVVRQGRVAQTARANAPSAPVGAPVSKEARLRELKQYHDQGLITDEVYADRQRAILSEP